MKKLIFTLLLAAVTASTWAVPARPGMWKTVTLANGSEVRVQLVGDEHAHFWRDANGVCYSEDPQTGLFSVADMPSLQQRAARRRARADQRRAHQMRRARANRASAFTGKKKGLIILVQFANKQFKAGSSAKALFQNVANTEGYSDNGFKGSVRDYFKAQSFGEFVLDFDVVGPYILDHNYSYYGQNDRNGDDLRPGEMIADALNAADADVNFADYDWDGDGEVEQVYVLYAGEGEASSTDKNTIWPHEWVLNEAFGRSIKLDGVTLDTYACGNELSSSSYDGIGTICHEFSHCLGYPDVYDTEYAGNYGMGGFDLMDSGSYNNDGFTPAGYTSYERWVAGWLQPTVLSSDTVVTGIKPLADGGEAFIVYNQGHPDEYYLVENRQKTGYDTYIPSAGLLFMHVDYDEWLWNLNMVNTVADYTSYASTWGEEYLHAKNDHQRMTPIPSYQGYYSATNVYTYPYGSLNTLSNTSQVSAKTYNKNTNGKYLMNCEFTGISTKSDLTAAFNYRNLNVNDGGSGGGVTPVDGVLFYESFDNCDGKGGNDDLWSSINGSFTPVTDNEGWIWEKANAGNQCLKLGTGSVVGVVTTPTFTLDGNAQLSFMAGAWNSKNDGTSLLVTVSGNGSLNQSSFTMTRGKWTEFTTQLSGTGSVRLTFTPSNRFFLDEVKVVSNETTGITTAGTQQVLRPQPIYTISGQYVGTCLDHLPHGIYIVGGRKVVR